MRLALVCSLLLVACAGQPPRAATNPPAPLAAAASEDPASAETIVEPSVKPAINEPWRSERIGPLVRRLESESREVWTERARIVDEVAARPGMKVADIGAGSGFLTLMLAAAVGPGGTVYALDINRGLLDNIAAQARRAGLANVETMVTPETTTPLAPESVDLVLMCDAYHHFEHPRKMMRSIRQALRPGGELVLVDLDRVPGKSPAWLLDHVRADKETFKNEILGDGFEWVREHDVPALRENYILRFRRPAGP